MTYPINNTGCGWRLALTQQDQLLWLPLAANQLQTMTHFHIQNSQTVKLGSVGIQR